MSISLLPEVDPTMQPYTPSQRARLLPSRSAAAAVLTAAAILGAAAPSALAQSDGWEHYDVAAPKTITLEFDTDLLAFDLCWSDHTEQTKEQIVNAAIAQMTSPGQLHVIDMPGLPPFYRRTSNASVWRDLDGDVIRSMDILPNRRNYHIDVEQALLDVAGRIREARPGAKLAFKGFELQPLPGGRPPAYEQLGAAQDFYITDRTIYLNHVGGLLDHALNSTFYRARVDFANAQDNWLVFPNQTGQFSLASMTTPAWPPAEFEPEILALWGSGGDDEGQQFVTGDVPVLQPGGGWEGPTEQPEYFGNPSIAGFDAKAIARWNVVPFQEFDAPFNIGVVAFHMNDIDRVEFSVEGGPWVAVEHMSMNERTDTLEYQVSLDPSLFEDDGFVEVRAIAWPTVGIPRVLAGTIEESSLDNGEHSMELFVLHADTPELPTVYVAHNGDDSNPGTRSQPMRTLTQALGRVPDGGEVVLAQAGLYDAPDRPWGHWAIWNDRYITIRPDDHLSLGDVRISMPTRQTSRLGIKRVRFQSIQFDMGFVSQLYNLGPTRFIWLDGVHMLDTTDGWSRTGNIPYSVRDNYAVTDSKIENSVYGFTGASLVRGCVIEKISGDALQRSRLVINTNISNLNGSILYHHTDLYQMWGSMDNIILFGIDTEDVHDAQAFFLEPTFDHLPGGDIHSLTNAAFVDIHVDSTFPTPGQTASGGPMFSQMLSRFDHIVFDRVRLGGQRMYIRDDVNHNQVWTAKNIVFRVCQLFSSNYQDWVIDGDVPAGITVVDCYE